MKISTYTCLDCWAEFEEPTLKDLECGIDLVPVCPHCGGDCILHTHLCDNCGQPITSIFARVGDMEYCDKCFQVYDMCD